MSCGIGFIQNTEIHELRSMVQNLITQHELISVGKVQFNVFEHFEGNLKQCPACDPHFNQVNNAVDKILSDVSTQLIGLGNFALSLLESLSESNQHGQEYKETIRILETKNSQVINELSQIQHENQEMKSKLQEMEDMVTKTDKSITEIQMINHQLKNSKILLENKLLVIESSILKENKYEINTLQKELTYLRVKNFTLTNEKQHLQKQVICLNQELRTQSFLPSKLSLKIESRSQSQERSPNVILFGNQPVDQPFAKLPIEEFNLSPGMVQTRSSLEHEIGSQKAFNFCLYSPSMSNVSLDDRLQIQSRVRPENFSSQENKENLNQMNRFKQYDDAAQKSQKQKNHITSQFRTEMHDKEVQVEFISEFMNFPSFEIPRNETQEPTGVIAEEKALSNDEIEINPKNQTTEISFNQSKERPFFLKIVNYLYDACITNRIKSKKKYYFAY